MNNARQAFESVFHRHRPTLIGRLLRLVACPATAEDLVQDAYVRVASALDRQAVDHPATFLFQTAHNLAIDHLRRAKRSARVLSDDTLAETVAAVPSLAPTPETAAAQREAVDRLSAAMAALPERARKTLMLSRVEGLAYPEIARRLGVSESTVYKDLQTALARCLSAVGER